MVSLFSQLAISGQLTYHLGNNIRILPGFHGELLWNGGSLGVGEFHRGSGRGGELHLGYYLYFCFSCGLMLLCQGVGSWH